MKVSIIGLGSVGSAIATAIMNTGCAREMVLFDRDSARGFAAAEDLGHASAFGFDIKITAENTYAGISGSDIVIIAAGANQKPGQTRMDLLSANANVIKDIIPKLIKVIDTKKCIIIVVSNPLDVMVMLAQKLSGMDPARIIGTGTMLDSARFKIILSRQLGVSSHSINAVVLGEHGDSSVLNWDGATVGNLSLDDFCRQTKISLPIATRKTIAHRVKNAAAVIISGRGATWDGIGAVASDLVRAIVNNERRVLTVSTVIGTGKKSVAISLPTVIGSHGAGPKLLPKMTAAELTDLDASADIIRDNFAKIKL